MQTRRLLPIALFVLIPAIAVAGCVSEQAIPDPDEAPSEQTNQPSDGSQADGDPETVYVAMEAAQFTPRTITVEVGTTVVWTNDDPIAHTVTPSDKDQWGTEGSGDAPEDWMGEGATYSFTFTEPGEYDYYCIPHAVQGDDGTWRGMVGTVIVVPPGGDTSGDGTDFELPERTVVPDPVAPPVKEPDEDGVVRYELVTEEVVAQLDDGASYEFWTFDGTVPGPMLRVREGDTVEVTITNPATSTHAHNIDLHAVTGPGGGAPVTEAAPGESASFTFKALHPGLYVYHCATPHVPTHIANGMYGMILVEPEEGLAPVDREYYIVQGEVYTQEDVGSQGHLAFSLDKLLDEDPEYFLFNGRVGALTGDGALTANVGEDVRFFFGVGGAVPSSFHLIGEVFDRVYMDGNGPATEHRQTVLVPAAGAATIEFDVEYPGTYILVDHTLSRTFDRGAAGHLIVDGEADSSIYDGGE